MDKAGNVKTLNIHVNSCGGYCDEGVAIYSMLKSHSAVKNAYVDGYACSIATVFFVIVVIMSLAMKKVTTAKE